MSMEIRTPLTSAPDVAKMYTFLLEARGDAENPYSLYLYADGAGHIGTSPTKDNSGSLLQVAIIISKRLSNRYVLMLWPLFLTFVESHKRSWGTGEYYVLALSKTGAVQIWDMTEYEDDAPMLMRDWPNLNMACSALETWRNSVSLPTDAPPVLG